MQCARFAPQATLHVEYLLARSLCMSPIAFCMQARVVAVSQVAHLTQRVDVGRAE